MLYINVMLNILSLRERNLISSATLHACFLKSQLALQWSSMHGDCITWNCAMHMHIMHSIHNIKLNTNTHLHVRRPKSSWTQGLFWVLCIHGQAYLIFCSGACTGLIHINSIHTEYVSLLSWIRRRKCSCMIKELCRLKNKNKKNQDCLDTHIV